MIYFCAWICVFEFESNSRFCEFHLVIKMKQFASATEWTCVLATRANKTKIKRQLPRCFFPIYLFNKTGKWIEWETGLQVAHFCCTCLHFSPVFFFAQFHTWHCQSRSLLNRVVIINHIFVLENCFILSIKKYITSGL